MTFDNPNPQKEKTSMNATTPGRIVRFTFPEGEDAPRNVRTVPAIITVVHSDDCVNLRLFTDGEPRKLEHRTSVMRSDEEGAAGKWAWPPRPGESTRPPEAVSQAGDSGGGNETPERPVGSGVG